MAFDRVTLPHLRPAYLVSGVASFPPPTPPHFRMLICIISSNIDSEKTNWYHLPHPSFPSALFLLLPSPPIQDIHPPSYIQHTPHLRRRAINTRTSRARHTMIPPRLSHSHSQPRSVRRSIRIRRRRRHHVPPVRRRPIHHQLRLPTRRTRRHTHVSRGRLSRARKISRRYRARHSHDMLRRWDIDHLHIILPWTSWRRSPIW